MMWIKREFVDVGEIFFFGKAFSPLSGPRTVTCMRCGSVGDKCWCARMRTSVWLAMREVRRATAQEEMTDFWERRRRP